MKYKLEDDPGHYKSIFTVSVNDVELYIRNSYQIKQFESLILSRLANMIVGWLFKHHRDELIKPIIDNVVEKLSREISKDILLRLNLPFTESKKEQNKQSLMP